MKNTNSNLKILEKAQQEFSGISLGMEESKGPEITNEAIDHQLRSSYHKIKCVELRKYLEDPNPLNLEKLIFQ